MENTIGQSSIGDRQRTAKRNAHDWTSRIKTLALWIAVMVPLAWGVLRAFDGVGYFIPQG